MPSTPPFAAIFKLLLVPSVLAKNEYTVRKDARARGVLANDKDFVSFSKGIDHDFD